MPTNYFSSYDGMKVMAEVDSEGRNVAGSINTINGVIPASARPDNKLVSRSELADELGDFGYSVADGDPTTGEPVVTGDKSPHMIYLVKDSEAPGDDKYFEWIWAAQDTDPVTYAWEKIGETSFELDIDTETFRTSILIDQNTPLLVDDDTPMVENDDVTLVKAVNGDEIIARRAREDVNGESLELRVENGKVSGIGGKDIVQPGLATVATTGNYNDLSGKPDLTVYAETEDLADVAFSGRYNDLEDKPPIPAAQIQADWNQVDDTAVDYIKNKPDYDDVVYVSYGTGTLDEISTAVNAGKNVIVSRGISGRIYYAKLAQYGFGSYYFTCLDGNTAMTWSISPDAGTGTWASSTVAIPDAQIQSDWGQVTTTAKDYIKNKPDLSIYAESANLAIVATSGSYNDLSDKPPVFTGSDSGLVPGATATDVNKVLKGGGFWGEATSLKVSYDAVTEEFSLDFSEAQYEIIGGKAYKVVTMPDGNVWMAENLDYQWNGLTIGGTGTPSTPNAWYYNNDKDTYGIDGTYKCGLLYNWYAAKYLNDNRANLIPGWHVPTKDELVALADACGGTSTAGTKLKALDNSVVSGFPSGWNGTDDYGFNAVPAGSYSGSFSDIGSKIDFWTPEDAGGGYYWYFGLDTGPRVNPYSYNGEYAHSIRLVKDNT